MELTQEILKEYLHYDPETGQFTWVKQRNLSKAKVGGIAGYIAQNGLSVGTPYRIRRIMLFHKNYLAHRLAWLYMAGRFPENEIDHIDRNSLNNKWSNLREASHSQNMANSLRRSKSGLKGVSYKNDCNRKKPYRADLTFNKKIKCLGYFKTAEEASEAYKKAAIEVFGKFASF